MKEFKGLNCAMNQAIHVLDQSAAGRRDNGEQDEAEVDKALAESFARTARKFKEIGDNIERRILRNRKRIEQGLPPFTLEEQLKLDEEDVR